MAPAATIRLSQPVAQALLVAAALALAALAPRGANAALSCAMVYSPLTPCLGYVKSGGAVPQACCGGIKSLLATARSTPDRRAACSCLKTLAAAAPSEEYIGRAAQLPGKCGVRVPFDISANVNCNSVN